MYTQSKLIKKIYFESRNTKGYNRITFLVYAQSQNYLKKNILRAGILPALKIFLFISFDFERTWGMLFCLYPLVFLLSKYIFLLVLTLSVHEEGYKNILRAGIPKGIKQNNLPRVRSVKTNKKIYFESRNTKGYKQNNIPHVHSKSKLINIPVGIPALKIFFFY
jgi:hypothetical protein